MNKTTTFKLLSQNRRAAKLRYPFLQPGDLQALSDLTRSLRLSVVQGEVLYIDGKWYITHAGLLRIAVRRRCLGIRTTLQERQSDPLAGRWVVRATVYKITRFSWVRGLRRCRSFERFFHGAWRRVADRRNPGRQPRPAQGLWHRPLLGRGVGCVLERAASFHGFLAVQQFLSFQRKRKWRRPAAAP